MSIPEEFRYGNIEPSECDAGPGAEYKEPIHPISRNEEQPSVSKKGSVGADTHIGPL